MDPDRGREAHRVERSSIPRRGAPLELRRSRAKAERLTGYLSCEERGCICRVECFHYFRTGGNCLRQILGGG